MNGDKTLVNEAGALTYYRDKMYPPSLILFVVPVFACNLKVALVDIYCIC
jgi:hypothetical protein